MPSSRTITVGVSLQQLRRTIFICCCAIGLGLMTQLTVWGLISFTEIRWSDDETAAETPLIIKTDLIATEEELPEDDDPAQAIRAVASATGEIFADESVESEEDDAVPTRSLSQLDGTLGMLTRCAKGFGSVGMIIILPLLMLSVMITAGTAYRGGEKIVGAFNLGLVLAVLVLPLGNALSLPWNDGALTSYENLTMQVDEYQTGPASALGPFVFYARYFLLPLSCIIGTLLLYLRFSSSVELAIIHGDSLRVDPDIEAEASNVKVGARGNLAANALDSLATDQQQKRKPKSKRAMNQMQPSSQPIQPQLKHQPLQEQPSATPAPQENRTDLPRRII